ncbi:MAG: acetate--CoA ligase family protein [Dehalococcoidia bacterium]|nr:acetate--CoA ligase family protein [Dehalococcoidia bacterium]
MAIADVVSAVRREGRTVLTEVESKEFVHASGIPVVKARLATSQREAAAIASEMGFPIALKIMSPEIIHKSDVGGVRLGLKSQAEVRRAYSEIVSAAKRSNAAAHILGVSVQAMAPPGVEVILGMTQDPQFGPVLMFGLGGVMVEVLKDVAFRLVPLTRYDARQMVREIRGYPILNGYRGHKPVDVAALENSLLKLSRFIEAHPEVNELDMNPVFVYPKGVLAVDARVILKPA